MPWIATWGPSRSTSSASASHWAPASRLWTRRNGVPARSTGSMTETRRCDLMIVNADVVTLDAAGTRYPSGAIAITGTRIADLGSGSELDRRWRPARTLDARGGLVHPGFVECHTHATIHSSRGLLGDDVSWLGA